MFSFLIFNISLLVRFCCVLSLLGSAPVWMLLRKLVSLLWRLLQRRIIRVLVMIFTVGYTTPASLEVWCAQLPSSALTAHGLVEAITFALMVVRCHSSAASASLLWARYISLHWLGWSHGGNTSAPLMVLVFSTKYYTGISAEISTENLVSCRLWLVMWTLFSLMQEQDIHGIILCFFYPSQTSWVFYVFKLLLEWNDTEPSCKVFFLCYLSVRCFLALQHNLEVLS